MLGCVWLLLQAQEGNNYFTELAERVEYGNFNHNNNNNNRDNNNNNNHNDNDNNSNNNNRRRVVRIVIIVIEPCLLQPCFPVAGLRVVPRRAGADAPRPLLRVR